MATRLLPVASSPMPRLYAESIIDSIADPLLAAKVSFRCLYRYMPKQKLNLVQLAAGLMAKLSASSPEIVRSELLNAGFSCILPDHVSDGIFAERAAPNGTRARYSPEDPPARDTGRLQPIVDEILHPFRQRNRSNVRSFAVCQRFSGYEVVF